MRKIKAIRNHILFQFEEGQVVKDSQGIHRVMFAEETDWGFTMHGMDDSLEKPRWGNVIAVGHECSSYIKPGMRILIENLKWTNAVAFDGDFIWRTDEEKVLGYDETSC